LEKLGLDTGDLSLEGSRKDEQSQMLAVHDPLTNLPNWLLFRDRASHTLSRSRRSSAGFTIFLMDLENLKEIKDHSGRACRDRALQVIANRLVSELRISDTVARVESARFGFILEDVDSVLSCIKVADKLISALSQAVLIDGESYFVNGRLGISRFPEDGDNLDTLIQNAEKLLEQARQQEKPYICPSKDPSKQTWITPLTLE
jgi:diguanylate cyclase (GGDEF)-like protein